MSLDRVVGGAVVILARHRIGVGLSALALLLAGAPVRAQAPFWTEDFNNGCAQLCPGDGYGGPNGTWRVTDVSVPGASANIWYVSCAENGNAPGSCGTGCGSDATLHVGNVSTSPAAFLFCPTGDCGAAYDTSGPSVIASKRIESPRIDASGHSGISARFRYLGEGSPCSDSADFVYSADGGSSWSVLLACLVSLNSTCAPQGLWTEIAVALPASADGNPSLKLGFHWRNDGDFVGNDPSFAVDHVELLSSACSPGPIPRDLGNDLRGVKLGSSAHLDWSAMGAPLPTTTHFHPYRATLKAAAFPGAWTLLGGDSPKIVAQEIDDPVIGDNGSYYYDVRSADDCENLSP